MRWACPQRPPSCLAMWTAHSTGHATWRPCALCRCELCSLMLTPQRLVVSCGTETQLMHVNARRCAQEASQSSCRCHLCTWRRPSTSKVCLPALLPTSWQICVLWGGLRSACAALTTGRARRGPTLHECFLMHAVARLAFGPLLPNIQVATLCQTMLSLAEHAATRTGVHRASWHMHGGGDEPSLASGVLGENGP